MTRPTLISWFLLLALGLIWGASFLGVELALDGLSPIWVATVRITLAAIVIAVGATIMGPGLPDHRTAQGRRIWLHALGMGLFSNAIPFTLLSWGQQHVTSSFAGITMAGVPLLVLPLAHIFVPGEQLTPRKTLGFIIGFVGVGVLIGPSVFSGVGSGGGWAEIACLAASACYAIGGIITRTSPPGSLVSFSAAALILASVTILPSALLIDGVPDIPGGSALGGALYLALFPTALATLMLVHVIKTAGPSFLSLVNYQVPVWATIIGAVVLSETLPPQLLAALALILLGLVVAQARAWRFRP